MTWHVNGSQEHLATVLPPLRQSSHPEIPFLLSRLFPSAPQIKWDTVPLDFAPISLKTKYPHPQQVGHFFDHPRRESSIYTAAFGSPKNCHTVPPFCTPKRLKTNDWCTKEVSQNSASTKPTCAPALIVDKPLTGRLASAPANEIRDERDGNQPRSPSWRSIWKNYPR
jgi:hypothetical protein